MFGGSSVRRARRAGTWYEGDPAALARYIESGFSQAEQYIAEELVGKKSGGPSGDVLGVIGPHAGLSYCGETSACAYSRLRDYLYRPYGQGAVGDQVERIFLIGPSHAKYFEGVQFPSSTAYATPLGDLPVDTATQRLVEQACSRTGCPTGWFSSRDDEGEHSLELHTPFISHLLNHPPSGQRPLKHIQLVPVVVGDMDHTTEARFGEALKAFLPPAGANGATPPKNLFVLSTDFCHWGERFRYTYRYDKRGVVGDGIERMDREAMRIIEANDTSQWKSYMSTTGNTICGRHVLASFMFATSGSSLAGQGSRFQTTFLRYSQSDRAQTTKDSSVSYAAGVITHVQ